MAKKRNTIIEQIALDMSCTPNLMPGESDIVTDENILQKLRLLTDLEQTDRDGRTLLLNAAFYNRPQIAEYLLERGCNVNAQDSSGFTPLHAAVQSDSLPMVQLLLRHGADINAADTYGNPPLLRLSPSAPAELLELLLAHGAEPGLQNHFGMCALDVFAAYPAMMKLLKTVPQNRQI